ncbi:hypothetical protein GOD74_17150 [Sinorhizobium medicae]|nr:hypothetical protein [Sinorhizobium medicae]
MSTKFNAKQLAEAMTIGTPTERRVWFPFRNSENRLAKLIRLVPAIALTTTAFNAEANAAELDQMFNSLESAYTSMEGARVCKLELQIGPELFAYAEQRVAQLEQKSKLSQAQKDNLRNTAVNEAPMLAAIGACGSVLAAFQILDVQRKFLEAQQTSKARETDEQQSASPLAEPDSTAEVGASPQTDAASTDETQLPIAAGAYVRSKAACDDLQNGELDMIDFDLEDNRRTFSTGENLCVVSSISKISASRSKVDATCTEFGDTSQLTFMLDRVPNGDIRINGDDQLYCPQAKSTPAPKASVQDLIEQWAQLTDDCRGGRGDDPETMKQCDKRSEVSERLEVLGYCYEGEDNATSEWRRCE